ncbi:hypothetical protein BGX33_005625 [Mortierella sp. NVP41]|nr:hypothetical protein BGX33_005625 [Mortierella sp. NVP41]
MTNPNLDEFYNTEGISEEEWKRVYDLRYCTILVPFEDNSQSGQSKAKHGSPAVQTSQGQQMEQEQDEDAVSESASDSIVNKERTPKPMHLATPRTTPARPRPKTPQSGDSTPTQRPRKRGVSVADDQDKDMLTADHSGLTESDPLTRYLTAETHLSSPRTPTRKNVGMDVFTEGDGDEAERSHDAALDLHMDMTIKDLDIHQQEFPHQYNGDSADGTSSTNPGSKRRRHWELSPSKRLLHPVDPHPSKRIALSASKSQTADSIASTGLFRPRSFTPSLSPSPSVWITPPTALSAEKSDKDKSDLCGSDVSSSLPWVPSATSFWKRQDWQGLEDLYWELSGEDMAETELVQVADRFLADQEALTGEKPKWSRDFVLTRCVALHRVHVKQTLDTIRQQLYSTTLSSRPVNDVSRGSTPRLSSRIGATRRSVSPYPVGLKHKAGSASAALTSPSSQRNIAEFVDERRADRARQQRAVDQGYQIKSVFKHRFAAGLKTVGQLLPFWRDVEKGHVDIKEEVAVPLVPAGKAHSVIEAFESQSEQARQQEHQEQLHGIQVRSRSGSVLSIAASWSQERMGRSASPAPSSVAEMISRGHSARAASAATTVSTLPTHGSPPLSSD